MNLFTKIDDIQDYINSHNKIKEITSSFSFYHHLLNMESVTLINSNLGFKLFQYNSPKLLAYEVINSNNLEKQAILDFAISLNPVLDQHGFKSFFAIVTNALFKVIQIDKGKLNNAELSKINKAIDVVFKFLYEEKLFGANKGIESHRLNRISTYIYNTDNVASDFNLGRNLGNDEVTELLDNSLPPVSEILDKLSCEISDTIDLRNKIIKQNNKNAHLIGFIRILRQDLKSQYGKPNDNVIASLANILFRHLSFITDNPVTTDRIKNLK